MNVIVFEAVGVVICLFFSAFFSSSETALTSLSGPQTHKLIEERGSKSLQLWLDEPIRVLTTILIGNNIVNTLAAALTTDLSNRLLEGTAASGWAIPVAVGIVTLLLLTFGEIIPKAVAKKLSKQLAPFIMLLLRIPYTLFSPFTTIFTWLTHRVMRLLGNDANARTPFVTSEEIEYMIDLGSREGSFTEDRERMLRSVFDFNDTLVREAMIPRTNVIALFIDTSFDDCLRIVASCGHSRVPVYNKSMDDIVGIFYVKDMLQRLAHHPREKPTLRQLIRKPVFVPESKRIADMLAEFQKQRIHMAIVVDEFGGTAGIITLEDIVEEFFGEIRDEYDVESDLILRLDDNTIRADARVSVYDIENFFGKELPDNMDYDTLGGFLMALSGTVPAPGEHIRWEDLLFNVLEADEKRVIHVEITRVGYDDLKEDSATTTTNDLSA